MLLESDLDVLRVDPDSDSTLTNAEPARHEPRHDVLMTERKQESWSDFDMREVVDVSDHTQSQAQTLRSELFGHKESFLPA